jgi:transcriptional regulator with XRE-family HTH domain
MVVTLSILLSLFMDKERKIDCISEVLLMQEQAEALASTLRKAREAAGLSVRQLENQTGVSKSAISHLEREGRGKADTLLRVARALELSAADVFLRDSPRLLKPPDLPAMLRAEYHLPPEAIKEIQQNIENVARRYRATQVE